MITDALINPRSIAVIGGSNNIHKPGGKVLQNIYERGYTGKLYAVNPKDIQLKGVHFLKHIRELPANTDLAIIAIPAKFCPETVEFLALHKKTRAFVILSAGFSEESAAGAELEGQMRDAADKHGATLIGPNCVGVANLSFSGIFTSPLPEAHPDGCDFISASGGTAVFILESALPKGLTFSSIYSIGNSAQTGVEDMLEYFDHVFHPEKSSKIKLLYIESIKDPDKLLKHSSSLIRKGCKIAAIKSGGSEAGSRAASSHTGALASSDLAVNALLRKAGIVRCYGREELTTVASVFTQKEIKGKNIAIITHAGGPAVMLTDALSDGGLKIPEFTDEHKKNILERLNPGASAANPIDLIATGTAEQLDFVIETCDKKLDYIDAMMVIFGSTGLQDVFDVYKVLDDKMKQCTKPIYPILPSISSAKKEVEYFLHKGHANFPDEVLLGNALVKVQNTPKPAEGLIHREGVDVHKVRQIIQHAPEGFVSQDIIQQLFEAANIPSVKEYVVKTKKELQNALETLHFPLAIKALGPVHKSDVGGVVLNIKSKDHLYTEFKRLMKIKDTTGTLIQPMVTGTELFIGAKYEPAFGHIVLAGLGGIFIEVLKDVSAGLAPLSMEEALSMIHSTRSYKIIQGTRGQVGVNEYRFAEIIVRLSTMLRFATEIKELDINPLIGRKTDIFAVDARVYIKKN